jgi:CheY-like chemotaxis protein
MAHILLADDERLIASLWSDALEDAGHTVALAHTGRQTVEKLKEDKFDLLITDLNMPDGGGFLVTSEAGHINDEIPIIVVSGDPAILATGVLGKMSKFGADAVLVKPVDVEQLLEMIDKVIAAGPRRSLFERLSTLFSREEKGAH